MREPDPTEAHGPFSFERESLAAGETHHVNLREHDKGRYRRYAPLDNLQIKNFSTGTPVRLTINGTQNTVIDPSTSETWSDVGVLQFAVENLGSNEIDPNGPEPAVSVTLSSDPYGADDQARERKGRHPLARMVNSALGL